MLSFSCLGLLEFVSFVNSDFLPTLITLSEQYDAVPFLSPLILSLLETCASKVEHQELLFKLLQSPIQLTENTVQKVTEHLLVTYVKAKKGEKFDEAFGKILKLIQQRFPTSLDSVIEKELKVWEASKAALKNND